MGVVLELKSTLQYTFIYSDPQWQVRWVLCDTLFEMLNEDIILFFTYACRHRFYDGLVLEEPIHPTYRLRFQPEKHIQNPSRHLDRTEWQLHNRFQSHGYF